MKTTAVAVEDTEGNRQICMKYCGICPSYQKNSMGKYEPGVLFCAHGVSRAPDVKENRCFCLACELFAQHHMALGHFCTRQ